MLCNLGAAHAAPAGRAPRSRTRARSIIIAILTCISRLPHAHPGTKLLPWSCSLNFGMSSGHLWVSDIEPIDTDVATLLSVRIIIHDSTQNAFMVVVRCGGTHMKRRSVGAETVQTQRWSVIRFDDRTSAFRVNTCIGFHNYSNYYTAEDTMTSYNTHFL